MNTTTMKALIFAAGALVGSAVTYILCSKAAKDRRDELVADYEAEIKELNESIYAKDIPQESQEAGSVTDPMKFKTNEKTDYSGYFNPEAVDGPKMTASSYENIVRQSSFPAQKMKALCLWSRKFMKPIRMGILSSNSGITWMMITSATSRISTLR